MGGAGADVSPMAATDESPMISADGSPMIASADGSPSLPPTDVDAYINFPLREMLKLVPNIYCIWCPGQVFPFRELIQHFYHAHQDMTAFCCKCINMYPRAHDRHPRVCEGTDYGNVPDILRLTLEVSSLDCIWCGIEVTGFVGWIAHYVQNHRERYIFCYDCSNFCSTIDELFDHDCEEGYAGGGDDKDTDKDDKEKKFLNINKEELEFGGFLSQLSVCIPIAIFLF